MKLTRGETAVAAAALLLSAPFLTKAWHVDEPFFLAIARQILVDPLHPLAFGFNWYGTTVPMERINNTPPVWGYLLAGALRLTGGGELPMRLLFWPLDALGAVALYRLAARYLERPLGPCLAVLASPAWTLNLGHLMPERLMVPLGLWALCLLPGRPWLSAVLLGLALLTKYAAVAFLPCAVALCRAAGLSWRATAGYLLLAGSGLAAYLLADAASGAEAFGAAWRVTAPAAGRLWQPDKARAILAFLGGCSAAALWAPWAGRSRWSVPLAAAAALLFLPAAAPWEARALGAAMAAAAVWAASVLWERRGRERGPWTAWAAGALALQALLYWSVLARITLLALPPLAFGLAEALESRLSRQRLDRLYAASFVLSAALTLALGKVDYDYARAQRWVAAASASAGRVWYSGHWGLQWYMEAAGARPIDGAAGGWSAVRSGDRVVLPTVNSNVMLADVPLAAERRDVTLGHPIPLRLISAFGGQAGFYTSAGGFLPWAVSREPLERFLVLDIK